jgi:hypothetical protein
MMREAQAMMQSPEFQAHMKKITANPNFKKAMQSTQQMMQDPQKAKEMEEKVKAAIADGETKLAQLEASRKEAEGADASNEKETKQDGAKDDDDLEVPVLSIN